jgi:membrane fusion protein (multidrug efflux system)
LKAKIRLDRVSNDYNRYNNLYKSHTITKQQYRTGFRSAENQVRILQQQQKKPVLFKVVVAKSKATDKQTDVADANIKEQHCLTPQC